MLKKEKKDENEIKAGEPPDYYLSDLEKDLLKKIWSKYIKNI